MKTLTKQIFCGRGEYDNYSSLVWLLDEITGESHPVLSFEIDKDTGKYNRLIFIDGYLPKDIEHCIPVNIFGVIGMDKHPKGKEIQIIFSKQYVKITQYTLSGVKTVFAVISEQGMPIDKDNNVVCLKQYNFDLKIITPEEFFVNISFCYRELHPELAKKYLHKERR